MAESGGSKNPESSGSPMAPRRIADTVIPTWTVEMNRTGSSIRRSAVRAPRPPRSARSSRRLRRAGHERVLGRDEDRVPEHEQEDDEDSQRSAHSPRGAPVLGGISSPIDQAAV